MYYIFTFLYSLLSHQSEFSLKCVHSITLRRHMIFPLSRLYMCWLGGADGVQFESECRPIPSYWKMSLGACVCWSPHRILPAQCMHFMMCICVLLCCVCLPLRTNAPHRRPNVWTTVSDRPKNRCPLSPPPPQSTFLGGYKIKANLF